MKKSIIKNNSRKKKKGFTLVELIAVMAIIAVLSSVLVPKVVGFIDEGKKTSAVEEARQVVLAIESFNISADSASIIDGMDSFSTFSSKLTNKNYIDAAEFKAIDASNTYEQLKAIVKGSQTFQLVDDKITVNKAATSTP
jgi:type IV pilus assembly protein PilA